MSSSTQRRSSLITVSRQLIMEVQSWAPDATGESVSSSAGRCLAKLDEAGITPGMYSDRDPDQTPNTPKKAVQVLEWHLSRVMGRLRDSAASGTFGWAADSLHSRLRALTDCVDRVEHHSGSARCGRAVGYRGLSRWSVLWRTGWRARR